MPRTQFQLDGGWKSISDMEPPLHAGQIAWAERLTASALIAWVCTPVAEEGRWDIPWCM